MNEEKDKALTRFIGDVSRHQLTVIRENGLYRHLRFKRFGSSAYWFDLVTWPGYLCVTGDMGTWTFSRIEDMFDFFTDAHFGRRESLLINPGYWSEKFEAGAGRGRRESPCFEFDARRFDKGLQEWLDAYLQDCDNAEQAEEAKEAINELKGNDYTTESDAYHAFDGVFFPSGVSTYDIMEGLGNLQTYSHHYLWVCYAIVWGIERYRTAPLVDRAVSTFLAVRQTN